MERRAFHPDKGGRSRDIAREPPDLCTKIFTLEGFAGTRGAVAEVDTFDHERRFGVVWPMRSYERVVHPIALPAHDWRITGLDVNRGYGSSELSGPEFTGSAAAPAKALSA